jgi:hypothetical protein
MKWTVSFLEEQKIVVIQTRGVADGPGSLEMAQTISKTMAPSQAKLCLIDHSALESVSGGPGEIYYRPKGLTDMDVPTGVKIAEVVLAAHREHFRFLETVCRNRGFDFRIFDDRESAIQWLTE